MEEVLSKGDKVAWNTSGKHGAETGRARSYYGDGSFIVSNVVFGVKELNPDWEVYVTLHDENGQPVMRGDKSAMFESYLFQKI